MAPLAKTMGRIDALGLRNAQLIYTNSSDLEACAEPQLAYNRTLTFRGGGAYYRHVARLERPQLIFADGPDAAPSHGLFGLMERKQGTCKTWRWPSGGPRRSGKGFWPFRRRYGELYEMSHEPRTQSVRRRASRWRLRPAPLAATPRARRAPRHAVHAPAAAPLAPTARAYVSS